VSFDSLLRDVRFAIRSLSKSPGFVVVAVVTLGLGLALASTTFTILDTLRHPYMALDDPDRLFEIRVAGDWRSGIDPYEAVRGVTDQFADGTAYYGWKRAVVAGGDSVSDAGAGLVTPNLFPLLGVKPARGRLFWTGPGPVETDVVIVSHHYWETALAGRPLDGATVLVNDRVHAVIGVTPPTVTYPYSPVWLPMSDPAGGEFRGVPVVRLKRGVTREQADRALALAAARLNAELRATQYPFGFRLRPVVGDPLEFEKVHFAMVGAAVIVLLIACANLANLMLARGAAKRREIALRFAIGANRRALVSQLLSESVVLAVAGGLLGLVLTAWSVDVLAHKMPPYGPVVLVPPHMSGRVLVFGFFAAGATLVLFGLLPSFRTTNVDVTEPLKDDAGTITSRVRRYSWIVVAEVAMTLVLLMGGALLTRAVVRAVRYDFGYEPRGLYQSSLGVHSAQAALDSVPHIFNSVLDGVRHVPGVQSAATMHWSWPDDYMIVSDVYNGGAGFMPSSAAAVVSSDFLRTLGIPVLHGRDFLLGDAVVGAVILDEDAARELFGGTGEDAVGRAIKLGDIESPVPWIRVVGVARRAALNRGSAGDFSPYLRPPPTAYVVSTRYASRRGLLVLRAGRSNASIQLALRREIRETLSDRGSGGIVGYTEAFERGLRSRRFIVGVFALFGALSLALAAVGIYGVLAYAVSRRMREFGVRVALGAEESRLLRMVMHDGAVMLLAGTGIGAFAAMWAGQLLDAWLYDVYFVDVVSLVAAELVLLAAGLAACAAPALRAMRANPVDVLRVT